MFYITGTLQVVGNIDREVKESYDLNVSVSDGKFKNFTAVNIAVNDTNDNTPNFDITPQTKLVLNVQENWGPGPVFVVNASDNDMSDSNNSKIEYSISEGKQINYYET